MAYDGEMLTEDQIVDAVCRDLVKHGYTIVTRATAIQHGEDIVATKDAERGTIEAKGASSSKEGTARYGKPFSKGQVFDHVAKAVLKALRVVAATDGRAGVALPDDVNHRREIEQVAGVLRQAGVGVFWVSEVGEVRLDAPWSL
jgi:Holliday junction resolvase-like predicted endonuclease